MATVSEKNYITDDGFKSDSMNIQTSISTAVNNYPDKSDHHSENQVQSVSQLGTTSYLDNLDPKGGCSDGTESQIPKRNQMFQILLDLDKRENERKKRNSTLPKMEPIVDCSKAEEVHKIGDKPPSTVDINRKKKHKYSRHEKGTMYTNNDRKFNMYENNTKFSPHFKQNNFLNKSHNARKFYKTYDKRLEEYESFRRNHSRSMEGYGGEHFPRWQNDNYYYSPGYEDRRFYNGGDYNSRNNTYRPGYSRPQRRESFIKPINCFKEQKFSSPTHNKNMKDVFKDKKLPVQIFCHHSIVNTSEKILLDKYNISKTCTVSLYDCCKLKGDHLEKYLKNQSIFTIKNSKDCTFQNRVPYFLFPNSQISNIDSNEKELNQQESCSNDSSAEEMCNTQSFDEVDNLPNDINIMNEFNSESQNTEGSTDEKNDQEPSNHCDTVNDSSTSEDPNNPEKVTTTSPDMVDVIQNSSEIEIPTDSSSLNISYRKKYSIIELKEPIIISVSSDSDNSDYDDLPDITKSDNSDAENSLDNVFRDETELNSNYPKSESNLMKETTDDKNDKSCNNVSDEDTNVGFIIAKSESLKDADPIDLNLSSSISSDFDDSLPNIACDTKDDSASEVIESTTEKNDDSQTEFVKSLPAIEYSTNDDECSKSELLQSQSSLNEDSADLKEASEINEPDIGNSSIPNNNSFDFVDNIDTETADTKSEPIDVTLTSIEFKDESDHEKLPNLLEPNESEPSELYPDENSKSDAIEPKDCKSDKNTEEVKVDIFENITEQSEPNVDDHVDQTDDHVNPTDDHVVQTDDQVDQTDDYVDQTDDHVNPTDDHVVQTDDQVDQTDDHVDQTDDHVDQTDDHVDQTDDHVDQTDDHVDQTDDHVVQTDDHVVQTDDHVVQTDDHVVQTDDNVDQTDDLLGVENISANKVFHEILDKDCKVEERPLSSNSFNESNAINFEKPDPPDAQDDFNKMYSSCDSLNSNDPYISNLTKQTMMETLEVSRNAASENNERELGYLSDLQLNVDTHEIVQMSKHEFLTMNFHDIGLDNASKSPFERPEGINGDSSEIRLFSPVFDFSSEITISSSELEEGNVQLSSNHSNQNENKDKNVLEYHSSGQVSDENDFLIKPCPKSVKRRLRTAKYKRRNEKRNEMNKLSDTKHSSTDTSKLISTNYKSSTLGNYENDGDNASDEDDEVPTNSAKSKLNKSSRPKSPRKTRSTARSSSTGFMRGIIAPIQNVDNKNHIIKSEREKLKYNLRSAQRKCRVKSINREAAERMCHSKTPEIPLVPIEHSLDKSESASLHSKGFIEIAAYSRRNSSSSVNSEKKAQTSRASTENTENKRKIVLSLTKNSGNKYSSHLKFKDSENLGFKLENYDTNSSKLEEHLSVEEKDKNLENYQTNPLKFVFKLKPNNKEPIQDEEQIEKLKVDVKTENLSDIDLGDPINSPKGDQDGTDKEVGEVIEMSKDQPSDQNKVSSDCNDEKMEKAEFQKSILDENSSTEINYQDIDMNSLDGHIDEVDHGEPDMTPIDSSKEINETRVDKCYTAENIENSQENLELQNPDTGLTPNENFSNREDRPKSETNLCPSEQLPLLTENEKTLPLSFCNSYSDELRKIADRTKQKLKAGKGHHEKHEKKRKYKKKYSVVKKLEKKCSKNEAVLRKIYLRRAAKINRSSGAYTELTSSSNEDETEQNFNRSKSKEQKRLYKLSKLSRNTSTNNSLEGTSELERILMGKFNNMTECDLKKYLSNRTQNLNNTEEDNFIFLAIKEKLSETNDKDIDDDQSVIKNEHASSEFLTVPKKNEEGNVYDFDDTDGDGKLELEKFLKPIEHTIRTKMKTSNENIQSDLDKETCGNSLDGRNEESVNINDSKDNVENIPTSEEDHRKLENSENDEKSEELNAENCVVNDTSDNIEPSSLVCNYDDVKNIPEFIDEANFTDDHQQNSDQEEAVVDDDANIIPSNRTDDKFTEEQSVENDNVEFNESGESNEDAANPSDECVNLNNSADCDGEMDDKISKPTDAERVNEIIEKCDFANLLVDETNSDSKFIVDDIDSLIDQLEEGKEPKLENLQMKIPSDEESKAENDPSSNCKEEEKQSVNDTTTDDEENRKLAIVDPNEHVKQDLRDAPTSRSTPKKNTKRGTMDESARLTSSVDNPGERLSCEFPGYNWLEKKIKDSEDKSQKKRTIVCKDSSKRKKAHMLELHIPTTSPKKHVKKPKAKPRIPFNKSKSVSGVPGSNIIISIGQTSHNLENLNTIPVSGNEAPSYSPASTDGEIHRQPHPMKRMPSLQESFVKAHHLQTVVSPSMFNPPKKSKALAKTAINYNLQHHPPPAGYSETTVRHPFRPPDSQFSRSYGPRLPNTHVPPYDTSRGGNPYQHSRISNVRHPMPYDPSSDISTSFKNDAPNYNWHRPDNASWTDHYKQKRFPVRNTTNFSEDENNPRTNEFPANYNSFYSQSSEELPSYYSQIGTGSANTASRSSPTSFNEQLHNPEKKKPEDSANSGTTDVNLPYSTIRHQKMVKRDDNCRSVSSSSTSSHKKKGISKGNKNLLNKMFLLFRKSLDDLHKERFKETSMLSTSEAMSDQTYGPSSNDVSKISSKDLTFEDFQMHIRRKIFECTLKQKLQKSKESEKSCAVDTDSSSSTVGNDVDILMRDSAVDQKSLGNSSNEPDIEIICSTINKDDMESMIKNNFEIPDIQSVETVQTVSNDAQKDSSNPKTENVSKDTSDKKLKKSKRNSTNKKSKSSKASEIETLREELERTKREVEELKLKQSHFFQQSQMKERKISESSRSPSEDVVDEEVNLKICQNSVPSSELTAKPSETTTSGSSEPTPSENSQSRRSSVIVTPERCSSPSKHNYRRGSTELSPSKLKSVSDYFDTTQSKKNEETKVELPKFENEDPPSKFEQKCENSDLYAEKSIVQIVERENSTASVTPFISDEVEVQDLSQPRTVVPAPMETSTSDFGTEEALDLSMGVKEKVSDEKTNFEKDKEEDSYVNFKRKTSLKTRTNSISSKPSTPVPSYSKSPTTSKILKEDSVPKPPSLQCVPLTFDHHTDLKMRTLPEIREMKQIKVNYNQRSELIDVVNRLSASSSTNSPDVNLPSTFEDLIKSNPDIQIMPVSSDDTKSAMFKRKRNSPSLHLNPIDSQPKDINRVPPMKKMAYFGIGSEPEESNSDQSVEITLVVNSPSGEKRENVNNYSAKKFATPPPNHDTKNDFILQPGIQHHKQYSKYDALGKQQQHDYYSRLYANAYKKNPGKFDPRENMYEDPNIEKDRNLLKKLLMDDFAKHSYGSNPPANRFTAPDMHKLLQNPSSSQGNLDVARYAKFPITDGPHKIIPVQNTKVTVNDDVYLKRPIDNNAYAPPKPTTKKQKLDHTHYNLYNGQSTSHSGPVTTDKYKYASPHENKPPSLPNRPMIPIRPQATYAIPQAIRGPHQPPLNRLQSSYGQYRDHPYPDQSFRHPLNHPYFPNMPYHPYLQHPPNYRPYYNPPSSSSSHMRHNNPNYPPQTLPPVPPLAPQIPEDKRTRNENLK